MLGVCIEIPPSTLILLKKIVDKFVLFLFLNNKICR